MKRYDVVITENAQQDLSFGFRVSSFEFRLIKRFNASTVTSQQSPVSGQEKVKSLRSKDTRQFNDSTIQQFND